MDARIPFERVLRYLETHGWELKRIWLPYRVFLKAGRLPILVRVEDRTVDAQDFAKIREIVRREAGEQAD